MLLRWLALFVMLAATLPAMGAESDISGSRDPLGIERFPRSWIVDYVRDDQVRPHQFVIHRLERVRREDPEHAPLRLDAKLESAIYQIPEGTPVAEVAAHFRSLLDGGLLYRCSARECGRSNEWANDVFGKAILYGPDANQRYFAWEWQGHLVSVYVIERGNKRVYVSVQVLDPADESVFGGNRLFTRHLAGQGWTEIDGIVPGADGSLPPAAGDILAALAPRLGEFGSSRLYLVCHLYGASPPEALRVASQRCAETSAGLLRAAGIPAGLRIEPFGAGPFVPRGSVPVSRLELVAPHLLGGQAPRTAAERGAGTERQ